MFLQTHPEIHIDQNSFNKCKPWFVRVTQEGETSCCCYHVEFSMQNNVFRGLESYSEIYPSSPRDFIHAVLCPRDENSMYHKLECISGKCNTCGHLNIFQPRNSTNTTGLDVIKWKKSNYITLTLDGGGESRRIQLIDCETTTEAFMRHFEHQIYPYIEHTHTKKWKYRQFRACLESFPRGLVIFVVNFVENYTFAHQQEIQSEYYFSQHVIYHYSYLY